MGTPEAQLQLVEWLCALQGDLLKSPTPRSITDLSASKGVPLEVGTLGIGSHGSAILYTAPKGFGSEPTSVVLKIHEDEKGVDNLSDYEIYLSLLLSNLCRGTPLNLYQASPHVVRSFGGMDAVWNSKGTKLVKRAMVMEPVTSPLDLSSLKDLLYEMRTSEEAWANGWMRMVLFQVIYTLALWGPRFRHNDLTPLNVVLQKLDEGRQKAGYAYALRLDETSILYFHTALHTVMPFEVKIIDFGMAMDLASPQGWSLPKLSKDAQRALGLETKPSSYFDLYSFLHTTYALSGFLPTLDALNDEGKLVEEPIFPSTAPKALDPRSNPEVKAFVDFMERYKIAKMPRVSAEQVAKATGAARLIRQWLPSTIQAKAEANNGTVVDDYGSTFEFFTPAQILQDPYFDPLRTDLKTFASQDLKGKFYASLGASWDPSLPTSPSSLIMACPPPSSSFKSKTNHGSKTNQCTSLDGQSFPSSLSLPLQASLN